MTDIAGMYGVLGYCAVVVGGAGAVASVAILTLSRSRRMGASAYSYLSLLASGVVLLVGAILIP